MGVNDDHDVNAFCWHVSKPDGVLPSASYAVATHVLECDDPVADPKLMRRCSCGHRPQLGGGSGYGNSIVCVDALFRGGSGMSKPATSTESPPSVDTRPRVRTVGSRVGRLYTSCGYACAVGNVWRAANSMMAREYAPGGAMKAYWVCVCRSVALGDTSPSPSTSSHPLHSAGPLRRTVNATPGAVTVTHTSLAAQAGPKSLPVSMMTKPPCGVPRTTLAVPRSTSMPGAVTLYTSSGGTPHVLLVALTNAAATEAAVGSGTPRVTDAFHASHEISSMRSREGA